jgi:hypothetical protein
MVPHRRHWQHHRALSRFDRSDNPFTSSDPKALRALLKAGDVLLVEGNNHLSGIIKYLTQSTWSHAALYVGPVAGAKTRDGEPHVLIEANIGEGVDCGADHKEKGCD